MQEICKLTTNFRWRRRHFRKLTTVLWIYCGIKLVLQPRGRGNVELGRIKLSTCFSVPIRPKPQVRVAACMLTRRNPNHLSFMKFASGALAESPCELPALHNSQFTNVLGSRGPCVPGSRDNILGKFWGLCLISSRAGQFPPSRDRQRALV